MRTMMFLIFLPAILVAVEQSPAPEKEGLTAPKAAVRLLGSSSVRPALAVLVGETLYYADASYRTPCLGKNLFAYSIDPKIPREDRTERQVADIPCVVQLRTDGSLLFVSSHTESRGVEVSVWDGQRLSPLKGALPEDFARGLARLRWKLALLEESTGTAYSKAPWLGWQVGTKPDFGLTVIIHPDSAGSQVIARVSGKTDGEPLVRAIGTAGEGQIFRDLAADGAGRLYLAYQGEKDDAMGSVAALDGATGKEIARYGAKEPLADWEKIPIARWAVRSPRYLEGTPRGFLVAERTPFDDEGKTVSYCAPTEGACYRVPIPSQDVAGIAFARGGILVAKPRARGIFWYGARSPFSESLFPSRAISQRPLSREEYEKIKGDEK